MSVSNQSKLNQLLNGEQSGSLLFSEWLNANGYSNQLLKTYRDSGWLKTLCRGVMVTPNCKMDALAAVAAYNKQMDGGVHVAAHSALELYGFNHYVPMGKPLLYLSHSRPNVPQWMSLDVFDMVIKPFSTDTFTNPFVEEIDHNGEKLLAASPEMAFLECLLLAPNQYNFMDLFYIMEQLTTLRPEIVQKLLETTKSLKVKRSFLYMAEKARHYWFNMLDISKIDLGTSKLQLVKNGSYISKYKITVPKELVDYE